MKLMQLLHAELVPIRKAKNMKGCIMARHEIYCLILKTGLLNIRQAADSGDVKQCFAEADHLHNMPDLLMNFENEELHHFYFDTMRPSYLSLSKPEWASKYIHLWKSLEVLNNNNKVADKPLHTELEPPNGASIRQVSVGMPDLNAIINDFLKVVKLTGINLPQDSLKVERLLAPHKPPPSLPKGKMAVYVFFLTGDQGKCLKVGKVGHKSQARYTSQHYNPSSSNSNLSKSIISAREELREELGLSDVSESNVGTWIKNNVDRANILINSEYGMPVLALLESFLQCRLNPQFEGFESQQTRPALDK